MQGFYFSQPVPVEALNATLAERRPVALRALA
jgi:EAL domain-containing protein (putative c-di-GMP-specific phosphodiesterase class I)